MKTLLLRACLPTILVLFASLGFAQGGQDAGGGNVFEAEFKSVGQVLLRQMKQRRLSESQLGFQLVKLEVALNEVKVLGTSDSKVQLNGLDRHAVNSPRHKLIVFTNAVWAILNAEQKKMLVLHEYLRFCDIDDSEYAHSLRIMGLLQQSAPQLGAGGRMFRVMKVTTSPNIEKGLFGQSRKDPTHTSWHNLYLEGNGGILSLQCEVPGYMHANWGRRITGKWRIGNQVTNFKHEFTNCINALSYLFTANAGNEVFVQIHPQTGVAIH